MAREDKIKQIKKWHQEGKIKKLGSGGFSVPSEAFGLGITPRLVSEVLKEPEKVYVVVGEWRGIIEKVEVYRSEKRAHERRVEIAKDYGEDKVRAGESTVIVSERTIIER